MANIVNQQTINYEVFVDGTRRLGTASVDLPELNPLTNDIKGAGVAGQMTVPTLGHMDNMEVTLHWRSISEHPAYLGGTDAYMLSLRAAEQIYDAGTGQRRPMPIKIDLRALNAGQTLGKLEPSEQTDTESKLNCDWVRVTVDGVETFEHDVFNFIHKVRGVDILADVRKAMGLE